MGSIILDENTEIGKAIRTRSIGSSILKLLNCLKKKDVTLKTAINIGPGLSAIPAAVFLKNGIYYVGLEPVPQKIATFMRNVVTYLEKKCSKEEMKKINRNMSVLHDNVIEMRLDAFQNLERPLLVIFYDSVSYLNSYATKKSYKREDAIKTITTSVVAKFYDFLKEDDVLACFWTLSLHMPRDFDAENFYKIVENKKFRHTFLIQFSSDVAIKTILSQIESMCDTSGVDAGHALKKWEKKLEEIKETNKPILFGVICIK